MTIYTHSGVALNQLSELEQDALSHYPGNPSPQLIKALNGGIMVFHNILPDLWQKGFRLRIVPQGTKLTNLPECADLKGCKSKTGYDYDDEAIKGLCRSGRLVVIHEKELLISPSVNQRYATLIHEVAHVVWALTLWVHERGYIRYLWEEERKAHPEKKEYRLENEFEFFADGFRYYVTPHRKGGILGIRKFNSPFGNVPMLEIEKEFVAPSKETLREANIKLFAFLEQKFKGIVEPDLVMARPERPDGDGDEVRWEYWGPNKLYLPVIYSGTANW